MANFIYNIAKTGMLDGSIDFDTDTFKIALLEGTSGADADHDTMTAVLAATAEASGTGYAPGAASADRQAVTFTPAVDDANDRADAVSSEPTFAGLDLGTVDGYVLYKHTGTNDSANIPVAYVDTATGLPFVTNGSDLEVAAVTVRLT